jgi:hypothetical protein
MIKKFSANLKFPNHYVYSGNKVFQSLHAQGFYSYGTVRKNRGEPKGFKVLIKKLNPPPWKNFLKHTKSLGVGQSRMK